MMEALREKRENNEGGFTLIELLIVIVILGVLAAVVIFSVGGITNNSAAAACKADASTINSAAEAYYAQQTPNAPAASMYTLVTPGNLLKTDGTITAASPNVKTGKGYVLAWVAGSPTGAEGQAGGVDAGAPFTTGAAGGGCAGL